jgi:hypothetical protein
MTGWTLVALILTASAEPAFDVEVIARDAFALAGPGSAYYPTVAVRQGQILTAKGVQPDGWVAVAPPQDSFSWILADRVKENPDGTATILQNDTPVYVGSSLSDAHHVQQVRLRKGDQVRPIDEQSLRTQGEVQRFLKVLPPPAERRYLPATSVRLLDGKTPLTSSPTDVPPPVAPPTPSAGNVPTGPPVPAASDLIPVSARVGTRIIPPAEPIVTVGAKSALTGVERPWPASKDLSVIKDDPTLPFAERVVQLKKQLGEMRSTLPSQWNMAGAHQAIETLRRSARNESDKSLVRGLEEIEVQFQRLYDRYDEIARRRDVFLQQDRELSLLVRQAQQVSGSLRRAFDAEGTLRPSSVSIDGQVTYVLEDAAGQPTHFVQFPPGLAGDRYLGRRVGLLGSVSRRDHVPIPRVAAEQISLLHP